MPPVVVVPQSEVPRLLPMEACTDLMADVFRGLSRGEAVQPLRSFHEQPGGAGRLALMPGFTTSPPAFGVKLITVFPGNVGTANDPIQGAVVLFDAETGAVTAVIDATALTAIRTAAASGAATRVLAREDAGDLAILGCGTQARTHLEAMLTVRSIRRVRVWSRSMGHARTFTETATARHAIAAEAMEDVRSAVAGADLICTTTASPVPILRGEWIASGAHINAVGAHTAATRELDTAAVARASLYVDSRASALAEAGDLLLAFKEGVIGTDHILGEMGEVLLERVRGRASDQEVTLFKSLGLAIQDVAAAQYIYERATGDPACPALEFGGHREA
jgi:ornithine cyclodeaminase/alanine dehydrogenase-like protein (mu-crystallin family)